ncbi:MAG: hypothetical protein DMD30_12065, partial [Gemmatimonadetes bacterium]
RDRVFPPQLVIDRMRDALRAGGNNNFAARIIPGASHGLTTIQTIGGRPFRAAVSPLFVTTLDNWVSHVAHR